MGRRSKFQALIQDPFNGFLGETKKKIFHTRECPRAWMANPYTLKSINMETVFQFRYKPCPACRATKKYQEELEHRQEANQSDSKRSNGFVSSNSAKSSQLIPQRSSPTSFDKLQSNAKRSDDSKSFNSAKSTQPIPQSLPTSPLNELKSKRVCFEHWIQNLCNTYQIPVAFDTHAAIATFMIKGGHLWKMQYCEDPVILQISSTQRLQRTSDRMVFPTPLEAIAYMRKNDGISSRDEAEERIEESIDSAGTVNDFLRNRLQECGISIEDFERKMDIDMEVNDEKLCEQLACIQVDEYLSMCQMLKIEPSAFAIILASLDFCGWG